MIVTLPGDFPEHRQYVSEELPKTVARVNLDSKLGGKLLRTVLKTDRFRPWKVIKDEPDEYEASIHLGKNSNRFLMGFRRITLRSRGEAGRTTIELTESSNYKTVMLIGFLTCCLPGVAILLLNLVDMSWVKSVIGKVGAEIKQSYPDASLSDA